VQRGGVWTVASAPAYAGKPPPVVIGQDDRFSETHSVTICALTTVPWPNRFSASASSRAPQTASGRLQPDARQLTTVQRHRLGKRIGTLDARDMIRLNRGLMVFPGLAG